MTTRITVKIEPDFKERNQSIDPSSKHPNECVGQVGCRCGMRGASLLPRRRRPTSYFSETATERSASVPVPPSSVDGFGDRQLETIDHCTHEQRTRMTQENDH